MWRIVIVPFAFHDDIGYCAVEHNIVERQISRGELPQHDTEAVDIDLFGVDVSSVYLGSGPSDERRWWLSEYRAIV